MFAFKFEHGDPLTGNLLFQHDGIQMEVLLVNVRNSIGVYGTECFLKLVDILCNQEPYKEIGYHMLGMSLVHNYLNNVCTTLNHFMSSRCLSCKRWLSNIK